MTERAEPMEYSVTAETHVGGDARVLSRTSTIAFDGTAQTGDMLPGPADLLCAALGACILKNVERFSHMLPFVYESATARVVAEREEPRPHITRMRYELRVVTDEPETRVGLLHRNIQKFGTVTNTLGKACDLQGTIRAIAKRATAR